MCIIYYTFCNCLTIFFHPINMQTRTPKLLQLSVTDLLELNDSCDPVSSTEISRLYDYNNPQFVSIVNNLRDMFKRHSNIYT